MKKVLLIVTLMSSIAIADINSLCKEYDEVIRKKVFASDLKKQLDLDKIPFEYYTKAYYVFYRALLVSNSHVFNEELMYYECVKDGICQKIHKEIQEGIEAMNTRLDVWYNDYCSNYEWRKRNKVFWLRDKE